MKTRELRGPCIPHLSTRQATPGVGHFLPQGCNLSQHDISNEVSSQLAFRFKTDFQDGNRGGHLGFSVRIILAIFDL